MTATAPAGSPVTPRPLELLASLAAFTMSVLPFADLLLRLPLPVARRFRRARARLDATIYRLIAERRASGEDRGDLLSMLLLAQDSEGDGGGERRRAGPPEVLVLPVRRGYPGLHRRAVRMDGGDPGAGDGGTALAARAGAGTAGGAAADRHPADAASAAGGRVAPVERWAWCAA